MDCALQCFSERKSVSAKTCVMAWMCIYVRPRAINLETLLHSARNLAPKTLTKQLFTRDGSILDTTDSETLVLVSRFICLRSMNLKPTLRVTATVYQRFLELFHLTFRALDRNYVVSTPVRAISMIYFI